MQEPILGGMAQSEADRSEPLLRCGNTNCGGCGMSIGLQFLSRAIADTPVRMAIPACCAFVAPGPFPFSGYGAPVVGSTFAATAAVGTGLAQVARLNDEKTRTICVAGDGGTYDIGMAAVSAAAERNEDLLYFCYDNEIYGNTGGQRSSATPMGASTTTTPGGKDVEKKDMMAIMIAHHVPYAATLSLADPGDALRKMRSALSMTGFRFLHMLAPCPTGWRSEPAEGIELVRLAVRSGLYAVYEAFDGERIDINIEPEMSAEALERYFSMQGRFRRAPVPLDRIRAGIEKSWRRLRARASEE
ncbi:MAG: 2-ketoisovalerate ferredoxin oxidoreductase [Gemmatimonadetes bacterium]|nr:2-ketoisovalerate ferredoxin oxidoreductase [Gemmatimonadota bacterium]